MAAEPESKVDAPEVATSPAPEPSKGASPSDDAAPPESPTADRQKRKSTGRKPKAQADGEASPSTPAPKPRATRARVSTGTPRTPAPSAAVTGEAGSPSMLHINDGTSLTLRALISSMQAGTIIGKGGQTVADLREQTHCKAGVTKAVAGVQERVLSITGELDNVAIAYKSIVELLLASPDSNDASTVPIRLLVSHNHMGTVIGKAGAQIQHIQQASGARMAASKEMLPQSTERVVEVNGTPGQVKIAVSEIAKCISQKPELDQGTILFHPGAIGPDGPASTFGAIVATNGGFIPSAGSSPGRRLSSSASASPTNPYQSFGSRNSPRNSPGTASAAWSPRSPRDSPTTHRAPRHGGSPNGGVLANGTNSPAHGGRTQPTSPLVDRHEAEDENVPETEALRTQNINIPADMVGCIIGRGGSKVAEIRRLSGSRIHIAKEATGACEPLGPSGLTRSDDTGERLFSIVGTAVENEKAARLSQKQRADAHSCICSTRHCPSISMPSLTHAGSARRSAARPLRRTSRTRLDIPCLGSQPCVRARIARR